MKELAKIIIKECGGEKNVVEAANCMTRVRIRVNDDSKINDDTLKETDGVLGVVHDNTCYVEVVVGPGKCKQVVDIIKKNDMVQGNDKDKDETQSSDKSDWKANKAEQKKKNEGNPIKRFFKTFGEIFVPLIPGIITAGLCSGFAMLITQLCPDYKENVWLYLLWQILTIVNVVFMTYITAWVGYRTAERFGGTPILGGMIGMATCIPSINLFAMTLDTIPFLQDIGFNFANVVDASSQKLALDSILQTGRGGVIAAVIGGFCVAKFECWLRPHVHPNLDIILTPLVSILVVLIPYLLIIMPAAGCVSSGLEWCVEQTIMSGNVIVRVIAGFVGAVLFLPLVAMGMHHSLIAIYTVQLNSIGWVSLYPVFAMAGAGLVGTAIALWIKAKKYNNNNLSKVITGSIVPAILGVGEPLIYGVAMPMVRPFVTGGLGAGFGGAFVIMMQCGSTTWGPSGLLGIFVMNAGPEGAMSPVWYVIGLLISYIMGFIFAWFMIGKKDVEAY